MSILSFLRLAVTWDKVCSLGSCPPWCLLTGSRDIADLGSLHSIGAPITVYPLFENGFRAHRGQSIQQNNEESARLYAEFAKVAEHNPFAWNYGKLAETAESIGTITKRNRMICFPCKLCL